MLGNASAGVTLANGDTTSMALGLNGFAYYLLFTSMLWREQISLQGHMSESEVERSTQCLNLG